MNAFVENEKPPETLEGLIETFETADNHHIVFGQYGKTTALFYNVLEPLEIGGKPVKGWLALPMHDCHNKLTGIAFISSSREDKIIFYSTGYPNGSVVFGKPSKDKPLFTQATPSSGLILVALSKQLKAS